MKTFAALKRSPPPARRTPMPLPSPSSAVRRTEVRRILHGPRLQPKLTVGAPDDKFEREADRVADQVVRMPHSEVADPELSGAVGVERVQRMPRGEETGGVIQRAVKIHEPYEVKRDFDPAARMKAKKRSLGRSNPFLNESPMAPRLRKRKFKKALKLPILGERKIPHPNLRDPSLDPVRANLKHVKLWDWHKRVRLVQEALIAWGQGLDPPVSMLPIFGADRIFGEETLAAVKRFQGAAPVPLKVDGIVGPKTLGALETAMAQLPSIFTVDRVAENSFRGTIHTPPFPPWGHLETTQDFVIDHLFPPVKDDDPKKTQKLLNRANFVNQLVKCKGGNVVLVFFKGKSAVVTKIEKHERRHESDQKKTIRKRLIPWDLALEALKRSRQTFRASSPREAKKKIFSSPGLRSPAQLANDVVSEWIAGNKIFHKTPAGKLTRMKVVGIGCVKKPKKAATVTLRIQ